MPRYTIDTGSCARARARAPGEKTRRASGLSRRWIYKRILASSAIGIDLRDAKGRCLSREVTFTARARARREARKITLERLMPNELGREVGFNEDGGYCLPAKVRENLEAGCWCDVFGMTGDS